MCKLCADKWNVFVNQHYCGGFSSINVLCIVCDHKNKIKERSAKKINASVCLNVQRPTGCVLCASELFFRGSHICDHRMCVCVSRGAQVVC